MTEKQKFNIAKNTKIREWYHKTYPNDSIYLKMKKQTTFLDLFDTLDRYKNIYYTIFERGGDSIVRERCFNKLAQIMEVEYNYIFEQWLLSRDY